MVALRARRAGAAPAALALLASFVAAGVGLRVDRFDAAHPVPTHLMYALDADTGAARWFTREADPVPWTAGYVTGPATDVERLFPMLAATGAADLRAGPAAAAPLAPPAVTVLADSASGDVRTVRVRVRPARQVRLLGLYVDAATARVDAATVAGRPVGVDAPDGDEPWSFGLAFHAPPPDGVEVELTLRPPAGGGNDGRVRLRVLDGSDGLTGLPGFRPRPPDVGVTGSHSSDLVLVARTVTL
jgi:outer membrane protein assembly factor BamB